MNLIICLGNSYTDIVYTIRGDEICRGTSYTDIAYTIRDNEICHGTSYTDIAYTIRGNEVCRGTSYTDIAYTIRGGEICRDTSYTDVAYTVRSNEPRATTQPGGAPFSNSRHGKEPWNFKKTICLFLTLALQAALLYLLASGHVSAAIQDSMKSYILVNVCILGNALISGILCLIAHYKIGSILSTIVNAIWGIYIFITAINSIEGILMTAMAVLFFGFIEFIVVYIGYWLSGLFCKHC